MPGDLGETFSGAERAVHFSSSLLCQHLCVVLKKVATTIRENGGAVLASYLC